MSTVEEVLAHKEKLEKLRIKKEVAQGELNAQMEQLKNEYECDTIEEAEDLLTTMKTNLTKDQEKLEKMTAEWTEKYSELLACVEG